MRGNFGGVANESMLGVGYHYRLGNDLRGGMRGGEGFHEVLGVPKADIDVVGYVRLTVVLSLRGGRELGREGEFVGGPSSTLRHLEHQEQS
jgi:hypothetical protein